MFSFRRRVPVKPATPLRVVTPPVKVVVGVCCMEVKMRSEPMQALISRLKQGGAFEVVCFSEQVILNEEVTAWPKVQCLISFYSRGFPLDKAIDYVKLVQPVELNKLEMQKKLKDRVAVYETLRAYEVPVPHYTYIDHTDSSKEHSFEEEDDYIVYDGHRINKPFVEKPIDGDNHNIWVYYPVSQVGGGCKKLIRKIDDRSSEFDPDCNRVRRDGPYVYEPFMPTQGMDVKVYMVGTEYSHAEARKAPTLDGKVVRSADGKEIRYPITLSETEKACGALIVKAFKQFVCGFDVLRTNGGSVVCDVNGFSFVKGNRRYYEDCAYLVSRYFLDSLSGKPLSPQMSLQAPALPEETPSEGCLEDETMKLRSVVVVMRHADRKPKEKFKFKTDHPLFMGYLAKEADSVSEVLLKSPEALTDLLTAVRCGAASPEPTATQLATLRMILEIRDTFSGLNRKVQIKRIIGDPNRALVVAKWGGDLTSLGRKQAEQLGQTMPETLFSSEESLLRLHSSFRHDFKIYSSQEGRCQLTAASFTKGFLDLDGDLPPILVSLVASDAFAHQLLDHPIPKRERDVVKQAIEEVMHIEQVSDGLLERMVPNPEQAGMLAAARSIISQGSPKEALRRLASACAHFLDSVQEALNMELSGRATPIGPGPKIPSGLDDPVQRKTLTLQRIEHRWRKIICGFVQSERFDTSLWDNAGYDILHNTEALQGAPISILQTEVVPILTPIHSWISGSEFGISETDKRRIGVEITWRLLQKIMNDVEFMVDDEKPLPSPKPPSIEEEATQLPAPTLVRKQSKVSLELRTLMRQAMRDGSDWHPNLLSAVAKATGMIACKPIRTRVYVTSASTMHSLVNVLAQSQNIFSPEVLHDVTDLHYLSHIVIRCYEDPQARKLAGPDAEHLQWYTVEISLSPGVVDGAVKPALAVGPGGCCCSLEDLDCLLSEAIAEFGNF